MMVFQHSSNPSQPLNSFSDMKQPHVRTKGWKQRSFNIQQSRLPDKEQIKNSMLAYSQKMHEMSNRKVFFTRENARIEVPLLVKATQLENPHKSYTTADITRSKKSIPQPASKSQTLPNLRLKPLLGNKEHLKLSSTSLEDLKTFSGSMQLQSMNTKPEPLTLIKADNSQTILGSRQKVDESTLVKHDHLLRDIISIEMKKLFHAGPATDDPPKPVEKVLVNKQSLESGMQTETKAAGPNLTSGTQTDFPDKLPPLNLPRRKLGKPRRSRRMRLHKPDLGVIDESEEILRLSRTNTLNRIISRDLIDPIIEQDVTTPSLLEEKRQEVVLHKRLQQSGTITNREASHLTMQIYAKKKVRQLAPLTSS